MISCQKIEHDYDEFLFVSLKAGKGCAKEGKETFLKSLSTLENVQSKN